MFYTFTYKITIYKDFINIKYLHLKLLRFSRNSKFELILHKDASLQELFASFVQRTISRHNEIFIAQSNSF